MNETVYCSLNIEFVMKQAFDLSMCAPQELEIDKK